MRPIKALLSGAVIALGMTVAAANLSAAELQKKLTAESAIESAMKRGKLRVGMSTFVPWAMRNKKGDLIGFEIDVATKVAKDLGIEVEFVPTAWSGIIPALIAGCLLYTSPSPRDATLSRMPSSA